MILTLKQTKLFSYVTGKLATIIWFSLALIAVVLEAIFRNRYNNYLIFKGVFTHTWQQVNLYASYPAAYFDTNHYGPLFSILIAPFAILPDHIGVIIWALANAYILYKAIRLLPIGFSHQQAILLVSITELMTSLYYVQFNPAVAALLILSFVMVERGQDIWATLFIAIGFMVKLYGIGGLAFFWFSGHKLKFCISFIGWLAILFALPMVISSPHFIIQSYIDWYHSLVAKDLQNNAVDLNNLQDISVPGMIKRTFHLPVLSIKYILLPAILVFAAAFLRVKQYAAAPFRMMILASVLLMVVLFSSSSESPTYIIAVIGAGIWWMAQPKPFSTTNVILILFVLVFTSLSTTDLFPHVIKKQVIIGYAFKALPCFVVWLVASTQLLTRNFIHS